jgi:hypothetical protein
MLACEKYCVLDNSQMPVLKLYELISLIPDSLEQECNVPALTTALAASAPSLYYGLKGDVMPTPDSGKRFANDEPIVEAL